jgi:predicted DNA-binding transcriptional regulator AlpA
MTITTTTRKARAATASTELWSIEDVSEFLRVPVGTLYQWRYRRTGPPAFKVGRHLRYDPANVRAWLAGQVA